MNYFIYIQFNMIKLRYELNGVHLFPKVSGHQPIYHCAKDYERDYLSDGNSFFVDIPWTVYLEGGGCLELQLSGNLFNYRIWRIDYRWHIAVLPHWSLKSWNYFHIFYLFHYLGQEMHYSYSEMQVFYIYSFYDPHSRLTSLYPLSIRPGHSFLLS